MPSILAVYNPILAFISCFCITSRSAIQGHTASERPRFLSSWSCALSTPAGEEEVALMGMQGCRGAKGEKRPREERWCETRGGAGQGRAHGETCGATGRGGYGRLWLEGEGRAGRVPGRGRRPGPAAGAT